MMSSNLSVLLVMLSCVFSAGRPNVCVQQEKILRHDTQPCVQTFTRMVKVWKQGCVGHPWCMSYERRCVYVHVCLMYTYLCVCTCVCKPWNVFHLFVSSCLFLWNVLSHLSSHSWACAKLNSVFNLYLSITIAECLTDHIYAWSVCNIIIYSQLWLKKM